MTAAAPAKADISALEAAGFQVQFLSHASAILSVDFPGSSAKSSLFSEEKPTSVVESYTRLELFSL